MTSTVATPLSAPILGAVAQGRSGGELATTTYAYDADGEQTSVTSPDGNLTGANAGNYTTVYDSQTGQLISVDPAISQTLEPYGYGDENPVSNTDPTGLSSCWSHGGAHHYSYRHRWVLTVRIPACIILLPGGARAVERILAFLNSIMDRSILGWLVLLVGYTLASDLVAAIVDDLFWIWIGMVALYFACVIDPWASSDGIRVTTTVLHDRHDMPLFWYVTYGCY